ncbi:MAG: hypothetical protein MZV49_25330 [Rhodopseudomonas palustris]|nr:hypothetical protein [Rhodopseudomonas palustris]
MHTDKAAATEKAKAVVAGGSAAGGPQRAARADLQCRSIRTPWWWAAASRASRPRWRSPNAGFQVYLVEREPSIGGHMAQFDKTFPTLDCSACILTPQHGRCGHAPEHHPADLERGR